jgi:DNA-3-methyladenine glycosylase I
VGRLAAGLVSGEDGTVRCWWGAAPPRYAAYHDEEWGRPVADDHRLFEKICLEGFQSGLSWLTILNKRDHFRKAFASFDFERVARFTARDVHRLLRDPGIVRHRGKIESTINNARRAINIAARYGSLTAYFWQFEPTAEARPKRLTKSALTTLTSSAESIAMSKELKKAGWTFVGPTTAYAFMQAMGLVNDHLEGCPARAAALAARARFRVPSLR